MDDSADGSEQFPGVGEAVFGIADEGFVDDGGEVFLQSRHAVADGDGVFVEDDVDGVALGIEAVGGFSGEELVEGGGEAPDVGDGFLKVDVGAVHAAEVAQGCHGRAGFEQEVVAENLGIAGNTEVAIRHTA